MGTGYTGLNATLRLTEKFGLKATVLDAAWAGWGASGRNGGFVGLGGAKLSDAKVLKRFRRAEAGRFFKAQRGAIDLVTAPRDLRHRCREMREWRVFVGPPPFGFRRDA
ncbi:MAG: FAD-dependent oxidoreductase [Paracoccaceae bacterium]